MSETFSFCFNSLWMLSCAKSPEFASSSSSSRYWPSFSMSSYWLELSPSTVVSLPPPTAPVLPEVYCSAAALPHKLCESESSTFSSSSYSTCVFYCIFSWTENPSIWLFSEVLRPYSAKYSSPHSSESSPFACDPESSILSSVYYFWL